MVPTVSVIVASYNYAQYVEECLESILSQTFPDFEVIVVDDGSIDNSLALINKIAQKDNRLRVYQHEDKKNHGLVQTISFAIQQCRGQYVAFLEADDTWQKDCLLKRIKLLNNYPDCKLIFNNVKLCFEKKSKAELFEKNIYALMDSNQALSYLNGQTIPANYLRNLIIENRIPTFSCTMLSTDLIRKLSLNSPVEKWMDWWLWVQASRDTKFLYMADQLTYWRIHDDSMHHKLGFTEYFRNYELMWKGFRKLGITEVDGKLLTTPSFLGVLSRLSNTILRLGLMETLQLLLIRLGL